MVDQSEQRRLAAILAADIVGYSRLMEADERGSVARLKVLRSRTIDPTVGTHHGRIVKTTGDGMLVAFASAVDAVECAVSLQTQLETAEAKVFADRRIQYRIGINVGDVLDEDGDLLGSGVNVAARLEGLAEPGGICISRTVRDQVLDVLDIALDDLGDIKVKNIERPVHVFRILRSGAKVTTGPRPNAKKNPAAIAAVFLVIAVAGAGIWWWRPWVGSSDPATEQTVARKLPDRPSIAVMPFQSMSGKSEQSYFAEGMTEDIITDLSKLSSIFVISRNSSFQFKGKPTDAKTVGLTLGVRFVLEGSVRRSEGKVRINAQLIDAQSGGHVWAERFDRDYANVFALQDEVVGKIVEALAVQLTPEDEKRLSDKGTQDLDAYDAFVRARQVLRERTPSANRHARELFAQAVERDPNFSGAYAGLALTYWYDFYDVLGGAFTVQDQERAVRYAKKSQAIEDNPLAHCVLAAISLYFERDHETALQEARKAAALAPQDVFVLSFLSEVLLYAGKAEEALVVARKMMRLDPAPHPIFMPIYGKAYFGNGKYKEAVQQFAQVNRLKPKWDIRGRNSVWLISSLANAGRRDEAGTVLSKLVEGAAQLRHFNLTSVKVSQPFFRSEDSAALLDGLSSAGLSD